MILYGYLYIVYALILTYLVIGFIISFETTAAMSGGRFAVKWIKEHFSYAEFYYSVILFYPMLLLAYFLLEYIPSLITREIRCEFNLDALFEDLYNSK